MTNKGTHEGSSFSLVNLIIILACLAMLGYGVYYFMNSSNTPSIPEHTPQLIEPATVIKEPEVEVIQPVSSAPTSTPVAPVSSAVATFELEELTDEEVDPAAIESLQDFSNEELITSILLQEDILRSSIVFIDNFSRGTLLTKFSPVKSPKQSFTVKEIDGDVYLDPASYERYNTYTAYIDSIDASRFIENYKKMKPSIDDSYAQVSRPDVNFNDTLEKAIEMVLDTPIINEPIRLESPSVMYVFSDSKLESLSSPQKLMLRVGPKNLAIIQAKLTAIQAELETLNEPDVMNETTVE